jgi:hypothetical protein
MSELTSNHFWRFHHSPAELRIAQFGEECGKSPNSCNELELIPQMCTERVMRLCARSVASGVCPVFLRFMCFRVSLFFLSEFAVRRVLVSRSSSL